MHLIFIKNVKVWPCWSGCGLVGVGVACWKKYVTKALRVGFYVSKVHAKPLTPPPHPSASPSLPLSLPTSLPLPLLSFLFFYWIFYLFTFQMLSPFPVPPLETPIPSSLSLLLWGWSLTHPLLPPYPGIPPHWGIEPSQDQGPLLLLMSNKAILCYICRWSHRFLHVYSFVGDLALRALVGWFVVLPMDCKPLQLLHSFL
jgi:hypothetical protein